MKVCLVVYKYGIPIDDPCVYPLGFMYISAVLKQKGHEVKVLNYNLFDYNFVKEVSNQDAVLFTGFEEFKNNIIRDAKICTSLGIHTVVGGALATFLSDEMLNYIDTVVVGEGEEVVEKALKVHGLLYGEVKNLDSLPFPDYEGFGIAEYQEQHDIKYMGVLTSRGCPFNCSFCSQTCEYQVRSLDSVFEEIYLYKVKYLTEMIIFNDNTFNINKERFMHICSRMKKAELSWGASIRVDVFDEEMAAAAKNSKCEYFVVGIESFNQERLNSLNKKIKVEEIFNTLNLLHKYSINYHGNVLVGFDNQSFDDIIYELNLIPRGYNVFPCFVYPFAGTLEGRKRGISKEQEDFLSAGFTKHIQNSGKYLYPVSVVV